MIWLICCERTQRHTEKALKTSGSEQHSTRFHFQNHYNIMFALGKYNAMPALKHLNVGQNTAFSDHGNWIVHESESANRWNDSNCLKRVRLYAKREPDRLSTGLWYNGNMGWGRKQFWIVRCVCAPCLYEVYRTSFVGVVGRYWRAFRDYSFFSVADFPEINTQYSYLRYIVVNFCHRSWIIFFNNNVCIHQPMK